MLAARTADARDVDMQLDLPLSAPEPPVHFVRHRRARRYIIRVLPDGSVRVTLPRWGAQRDAQAFLVQSAAWVAQQQARRVHQSAARVWQHGSSVLFHGEPHALRVQPCAEGLAVTLNDHLVASGASAAAADLRGTVERWLRAQAARELPAALRRLAAVHDIEVTAISIRNQRSRWGSCSPRGGITLNWRLVQAPAPVAEYVIIHELMHRRELNHSRRFWRHVARACPEYRAARRWLLDEGRQLF